MIVSRRDEKPPSVQTLVSHVQDPINQVKLTLIPKQQEKHKHIWVCGLKWKAA